MSIYFVHLQQITNKLVTYINVPTDTTDNYLPGDPTAMRQEQVVHQKLR